MSPICRHCGHPADQHNSANGWGGCTRPDPVSLTPCPCTNFLAPRDWAEVFVEWAEAPEEEILDFELAVVPPKVQRMLEAEARLEKVRTLTGEALREHVKGQVHRHLVIVHNEHPDGDTAAVMLAVNPVIDALTVAEITITKVRALVAAWREFPHLVDPERVQALADIIEEGS